MGVGMATTSLGNALVIHAVAAPVIFALVSRRYFSRSSRYTPLVGAAVFVVVVMAMDFFVVALIINRSLEMFTSLLGTWVPFVSIFASSYLTGLIVTRGGRAQSARAHHTSQPHGNRFSSNGSREKP